MKQYLSCILLAGMVFFFSCSKDSEQGDSIKPPETVEPEDKRIDLSIKFKRYVKDSLYKSDTIWGELIITNLSKQTLRKGDSIIASCDLQGEERNLRLEDNPRQTPILLQRDIAPNDTVHFDPSYVFGTPFRLYFQTDTVRLGLRVYGVNKPELDHPKYSSDPNPENNRTELVNTIEGNRVIK